jgi:WD40 repeat protein
MKTRNTVVGVVQVLISLFIATACSSGPSSVATTSPTTATVFDDHFGFLIGNAVRRESDPQPLFTLGIANDSGGVISPDGRRLAYWAANELRVIDITPNAQPRTLVPITGRGEGALYFAWSSDSTGLVVGVNGGGGGQADAPPGYTALRVVDVSGGQPREIVRVRNANVIPLAWDRQSHLIAGYSPSGTGARSYYVVEENGTLKTMNAGPGIYVVEASQDGQQVLGRGDPNSVVRVWPRGSYADGVELRATGDDQILWAAWRPGTTELGVLFADRVELWNVNGARRAIPLPAHSIGKSILVFRADGKSVFALGADVIAVDIASGRANVVEWSGPMPEPGKSVRIGT